MKQKAHLTTHVNIWFNETQQSSIFSCYLETQHLSLFNWCVVMIFSSISKSDKASFYDGKLDNQYDNWENSKCDKHNAAFATLHQNKDHLFSSSETDLDKDSLGLDSKLWGISNFSVTKKVRGTSDFIWGIAAEVTPTKKASPISLEIKTIHFTS